MKPINIVLLLGWLVTASAVSGQANVNAEQLINLAKIDSFGHFLQSSLPIPPEVSFIDKDRLAVTFLNPCPERSIDRLRLKEREQEKESCGLVVTVLVVDFKTRQVQQSLTIPFRLARQSMPSDVDRFRLLLPTRQGGFLVHSGDFLLRYGSNLELIEKRPISNPDRTVVFVSPNGALVLLNEYEDVGRFRKSVFPADNIQGGKLFGVGWPAKGVMDDGRVLSLRFPLDHQSPKFTDLVKAKDGNAKCATHGFCVALCVSEDECHLLGGLLWRVDDTKFVTRIAGRRNTRKYAIADRTGKVLYIGSATLPVDHFAAGPAAAQRLSIISAKARSKGMTYDVDVLNLREMKIALKVRLLNTGVIHSGWIMYRDPDAAVSPDGDRIAILAGSELRLYPNSEEQLPVSSKEIP